MKHIFKAIVDSSLERLQSFCREGSASSEICIVSNFLFCCRNANKVRCEYTKLFSSDNMSKP